MKNDNKFLVTWVEQEGMTRGQATKTREEAERLFTHLTTNTEPQFVEIRRIGSLVRHYNQTPGLAREMKPLTDPAQPPETLAHCKTCGTASYAEYMACEEVDCEWIGPLSNQKGNLYAR